MVQIQVGSGLRKVQNMIKQLPKSIQKEVGLKGSKEIAKTAQKKIIFQYTVAGYKGGGFGIKSLKKRMIFKQSGNSFIYTLNIPRYLAMIEKGVQSHYVSIETIKQQISSPDSTTGKRQPKGTVFSGPPIWWQYKGPFISPAFKSLNNEIPKILERAVSRAIKLSK